MKILILFSTAYAMFRMFHWALGFSYFTQLSNLFVAVVVLWQLIRPSSKATLVKYTATVSIIVTFLVYLFVLAPLMPGGIIAAYRQDHWASLCLHVITQILTVIDFLWVDCRECTLVWKKSHALLAVVPPLAYFVFILFLHGLGIDWMGMSAPYLFLNYAAPAGWFGFMPETSGPTTMGIGVFYVLVVMIGAFFLVGWLLLLAAQKARKSSNRKLV